MSRRTILSGGSYASFTNAVSTRFNGVNQWARNLTAHRFDNTTSFTIACWFNMTSLKTNNFITSCCDSAGRAGYYLQIITVSGQPKLRFSMVDTTGISVLSVTSTNTMVTGQWYNVVVTYRGTNDGGTNSQADINLYIDGLAQTIKAGSLASITNNNLFQISGLANVGAILSDMDFDEIYIYNVAKDAAFATDFYNSGDPKSRLLDSNLVSGYRMGDGDTLPTVTDIVGANDLTLVNGATFVNSVP